MTVEKKDYCNLLNVKGRGWLLFYLPRKSYLSENVTNISLVKGKRKQSILILYKMLLNRFLCNVLFTDLLDPRKTCMSIHHLCENIFHQ